MAAPQFVVRSYGGGAVVAQLTQTMGPSDTSFAISPTTGWTDQNANPLGTTGPFTVVIDRFTASVEKILCSAINLTTGVVTVFTSSGFSGRGYDGTFPQAHVPGGSTSGVQTCWSSEEAFEANQSVSLLYGGVGATTGQIITWNGTAPAWATGSALSGQPAGTVHAVTGGIGQTVDNLFTSTATDFLAGGMVAAANGLIVPVAGIYQATTLCWCAEGGFGPDQVQCYIAASGSALPNVIYGSVFAGVIASAGFYLHASGTMKLIAGATVNPVAISSASNASLSLLNTAGVNYLSVHLVSQ